jgi:hypothetical protein
MTLHSSASSSFLKSKRALSICTLAGVEKDSVTLHGAEIIGRWKRQPDLRISTPGRTLAEDLANWRSEPKEILRFIRLYGPLVRPKHLSSPLSLDLQFRESLDGWRDHQRFVRKLWREGESSRVTVGMKPGEQLQIGNDRITIVVESLARFLEFEIYIYPSRYRRICANPECPAPYFIANRTTHRLCNRDECREWAQGAHKREWWAKHGAQWRAARAKKKQK